MKNGFQWFSKFAFNCSLRHYNMSDEDLVFVNLKPQPASGGAGDGPLEDMSARGPKGGGGGGVAGGSVSSSGGGVGGVGAGSSASSASAASAAAASSEAAAGAGAGPRAHFGMSSLGMLVGWCRLSSA